MSFLPIAILAYVCNGTATIIDKILLQKTIPSPFAYVFYISVFGMLVIVLLPFGIHFTPQLILFGGLAGILHNLALLAYFQSLKKGEASVVGPVVGGLNPLFSLLIGSIFLGLVLNPTQLMAFFFLMLGAVILTYRLWSSKLEVNHQLLFMVLSGFLFAMTYLLLKQAFEYSNFIGGLFVSRIAAGAFIPLFLLYPSTRRQIFSNRLQTHGALNKDALLLVIGQIFGAFSGLLITLGVSLTTPALVNALFGVQYLVILGAAMVLGKNHPKLLDENLTKSSLVQKIIGAGVLSWGVYLLSK